MCQIRAIRDYVNNNGGPGTARLPPPPFSPRGTGRQFQNRPNRTTGRRFLPTHDSSGNPIRYTEYDIKIDPRTRGASNRGGHRVVMGSDGKNYSISITKLILNFSMSTTFVFDENKIKSTHNIYKICLDGKRAKTQSEFNQEMIKIFKLPPYFKGNLDSLEECLNDLSWLSETDNFEVTILNFDFLLEYEKKDYLIAFIEVLKDIDLNFFRNSNDKIKQFFYVVLEKTIKSVNMTEQLGIKIYE